VWREEWSSKENKGSFGRTMMQALELLRLVKRHISRQSDVSSEEIKPVASCLKALVGASHILPHSYSFAYL